MNAPTFAPMSAWLSVHPTLGISLMDHLYNRLDGAYPRRWREQFPTEQAIANWRESWAETFDAEGLTPAEVKAGLAECRTRYDWPPSVAEFVKACRPAINVDAALCEAVEQLRQRNEGRDQWTNPAFYWAALRVGTFDMLNLPHAQLVKRFAAALADVMRDEVKPVPPRAEALPAPGKATASPERVAAHLAQLRALRTVPAGRQWAVRLLERYERGEKISPACVDMARRALRSEVDPCA